MRRHHWTIVGSILAGLGLAAARRSFERDISQIEACIARRSLVAQTAGGAVQYGRAGTGSPVLLIHGAGGGFDQGLLLGHELFGDTADVIAPSRFGYLGTPEPTSADDATVPAAQADAHRALLDELAIEQAVVVAASAGAPGAVELAVRWPSRVSALILLSPRLYAPEHEVSADASGQTRAVLTLTMAAADFSFWCMSKMAPSWIARAVGVPPKVLADASAADQDRIADFIRTILPLRRRVAGLRVDANTVIGPSPLSHVAVPTLVIAARDDLYGTMPAACYTAAHTAGAELTLFDTGGHLLVGRGDEVRDAISAFLLRQQQAQGTGRRRVAQ